MLVLNLLGKTLPSEAATTGMGMVVEKMKERPLDCIKLFHLLL
jgi:hypothetical protein